jgi:two-component system sensor histidine kinase BaeS
VTGDSRARVRRPGSGLGPLGRRLFAAFGVVALASVALLAAAAIVAANRGIDTARQGDRQAVATRAAAAAGRAYADAGGWSGAQLDAARAIADGGGAGLTIRDANGAVVSPSFGSSMMGGSASGMGPAMSGGMTAAGPTADASVVVAGRTVGSVRLVFVFRAGAGGSPIAWPWVLAAGCAALAVALAVSWYVTRRVTGPIVRVSRAAQAIAAGDRGARAELSAPGELGELARVFDTMADDLARAERSRRNMAADVAHELRTPLAALQAGLEELRDGHAEADTERLAGLHDQTLRLGRIVGDLAELSEAESGVLSLRMKPIDLNALVAEAVAQREPQLRAAGLTVHVLLHPGAVTVRGDSDRLHQALGNLLSNTARYCAPGDAVTVTVTTDVTRDRRARIEVADTGPGIRPEDLPHVFDRFWRGSAGRAAGGTGIGLAVVRALISAHGGTVEAGSGPGPGARFVITLPGPAANRPERGPASGSAARLAESRVTRS